MCGLVGFFGEWFLSREKAFLDLLKIDVIRGDDSTGTAFFNTNGHTRLCKDILLPELLIKTKGFEKSLKQRWNGYMGHNRLATKGDVKKENAHPFMHGKIVGAHNGTLTRQDLLPDNNKFEVDSENLIYSINKIGIEETWKKTDGAAALTWWDSKKKTLNLLRNKERMLYFAVTQGNDGVFWASEAWMLHGVLDRNNIAINKVYILPENILYSYKISKAANSNLLFLSCTETKLEEYKFIFAELKRYSYFDDVAEYGTKQLLNNNRSTAEADKEFKDNLKKGKYTVIPERIIITHNNNKTISNKLICSFEDHRSVKIEMNITEEQAREMELCLGPPPLFTEIKIYCEVIPIVENSKLSRRTILFGNAKTYDIYVPRNAYRNMANGRTLTQEQFEKEKKRCIYCESDIGFTDLTFVEDPESDNILCGNCANDAENKSQDEYTIGSLFKLARSQ